MMMQVARADEYLLTFKDCAITVPGVQMRTESAGFDKAGRSTAWRLLILGVAGIVLSACGGAKAENTAPTTSPTVTLNPQARLLKDCSDNVLSAVAYVEANQNTAWSHQQIMDEYGYTSATYKAFEYTNTLF
jgi:hypothetical protein